MSSSSIKIPVNVDKIHFSNASFLHSNSSFVIFLALKTTVIFIKYSFCFCVDFSKLSVNLLVLKVTMLGDRVLL